MVAESGAVPLIGQNSGEQQNEAKPLEVRTAVVLFMTNDGEVVGSNDLRLINDKLLSVQKIAHPDEFLAMCHVAASDIDAQRTAGEVSRIMQMAARAAMEQQRNAAILSQLKNNGKG